MLSDIEYGVFADYSPKGVSEVEIQSKTFCGNIKSARPNIIHRAVDNFSSDEFLALTPFLNPGSVLVPIPRSSPIKDDAIWPAKAIADILVARGYGDQVFPCIRRLKPIRKSSFQMGSDHRPSVKEHYDSLVVDIGNELFVPSDITLIDDVVTAGRTAFACAQRLREVFPDAKIRLFAMIRTQSFSSVTKIVTFSTGKISYNPSTGKTFRS